MSVDVTTETTIARPREEVAAFASEPTNATRWYRNIRAARWESTPPLGVGSRFRFQARFLGRTLDYSYEVLELEPGTRLVMSTVDGPFLMETTYTWQGAGDGTRMTLRNHGEPEGFMGRLRPVLETAMRRANRSDLARLKGLLEGGDSDPSREVG